MKSATKPYILLPFRFTPFSGNRMLVVNEVGEYIFLKREDFEKLVSEQLDPASPLFLDLKGKHLLTDTKLTPVINLLATKYRTKREFLKSFTALHMVVTTLRCNQHCRYCHASSQPLEQERWDMSPATAVKIAHTIMASPAPVIKIEFQGGESLLNLEVVKTIVTEAKRLNRKKKKNLSFVICTNLTLMDEPTLRYLKQEGITVSSSLDGPREIHDRHRRLRTGEGSYVPFIRNLHLAREVLGHDQVHALVTITRDSLPHLQEIIDEYVALGFPGIFLRHINPYGYALEKEHRESFHYSMEEFIEAYKKALLYIIELNLKGQPLVENYATILLSRILTPFSTGFVDLQSPTGAGISGVIYDYNGDVYPSDEGRMLAKMGDRRFYLGNVHRDSYVDIFTSPVLKELIEVSCVETLPGCHSCALQTYCGADPVRNYAVQGHLAGHRPTSDFCFKHRAIITFLLEILEEDDPEVMDVFWSWITNRTLAEVRGEAACRA
ncbi:MAG: His-Xaa-Ser system radical SAM maturase HxsB [Thermodesulfobacteriota bacterium]